MWISEMSSIKWHNLKASFFILEDGCEYLFTNMPMHTTVSTRKRSSRASNEGHTAGQAYFSLVDVSVYLWHPCHVDGDTIIGVEFLLTRFRKIRLRSCKVETFLTFWGPCIVVYSYKKKKRTRCIISQIYVGIELYMFRTGLLSIIRSPVLYTKQ